MTEKKDYNSMSAKELMARIRNEVSMMAKTGGTAPLDFTQAYGEKPQLQEPSTMGSQTGGIFGSLVGIPFGEKARVGAAGLFGAIGDVGEQAVNKMGAGYPPPIGGFPQVGFSTEENPNLGKGTIDFEQAAKEGGINMMGEYFGDKATNAAIKTISPYGHILKEDAKDIAKNLAEYGGQFTPDIITKSPALSFMKQWAQSGPTGAGKMSEFTTEKIIEPVKRMGEKIRRGMGDYLPPNVRGNEAKRLLKLGDSLAHDAIAPFYKEADELMGMAVVPKTDTIKNLAQEYIEQTKDVTFGSKTFASQAQEIIDDWPERMLFSKGHKERSALMKMSRAQQDVMNDYDETWIQRMVGAVNDAMEEGGTRIDKFPVDETVVSAEKSMFKPTEFSERTKAITGTLDPTEGYAAYRRAADKYKEWAELIGDRNIVDILRSKDGVQAAGRLLPPKNPESVSNLFAAIRKYNPSDEAEKFVRDVKASWFEDVLEKKGLVLGKEESDRLGVELKDKFSQKFNSSAILEEFNKYGATYDILAGENKKEIARFFKTLQFIDEANQKGQVARIFVAMKTAGAPGLAIGGAVTIASGQFMIGLGLVGGGLGILISPKILAEMMTSKPMMKYLTNTLASPSRQRVRELGRLIGKFAANRRLEPAEGNLPPFQRQEQEPFIPEGPQPMKRGKVMPIDMPPMNIP